MDLKTKKPLRKLKNPSKASYGGLLGTPIHTLSREILELCVCYLPLARINTTLLGKLE
jgi:hypothetical protein